MYVCIAWQLSTDDPVLRDEISHAVDVAFGTLARCKILARTVVLRPITANDLATLIAQLDGIEQAFASSFGYALFLHADGERYRCSDPFDEAAARAVTKAEPI